jgi:hypothetical protein
MKKVLLSLISVLFTVLPFTAALADSNETFSSGKDWMTRLNDREKIIAIIAPTVLLHRYGVPIQKSPDEYLEKIDKVLEKNPDLAKEDISNIYASTVYYYEPWTRKPLEELELAFLRGETEPSLLNAMPRLTIKHLSREALEEEPQE